MAQTKKVKTRGVAGVAARHSRGSDHGSDDNNDGSSSNSAAASMSALTRNPLAREWQHIPKLVVFDLDFTLWYPEMYELDGAPFRKNAATGAVTDRSGEQVHFFPAVHDVLSILELDAQFRDTTEVAVASKTTEPHWAKTCMRLLDIELDGGSAKRSLHSVVDYEAIYPRNKRVHFEQLQEQSGVAYADMLFFDNEFGNIRDISKLGVVCVYCPHGLSDGVWLQGMDAFQLAKRAT